MAKQKYLLCNRLCGDPQEPHKVMTAIKKSWIVDVVDTTVHPESVMLSQMPVGCKSLLTVAHSNMPIFTDMGFDHIAVALNNG